MTEIDTNTGILFQSRRDRIHRLSGLFRERFPIHESGRIFSTSGRTEIAGNHTDHQGGRVLCAAVDLDILAMAAPNQDGVIRVKSEEFTRTDEIDLSVLAPKPEESRHSASLIRGVAAGMRKRGFRIGGFDAYTTSRIPKGSGLSSSAAFEVLIATILNGLYNGGAAPNIALALAAQEAETVFFGKPSGLMDQCACAFGGLLGIDFKIPGAPSLATVPVDFGRFGHTLVITNTGGSHSDLNDDYASIPGDMKKIARCFGKEILSEIAEGDFLADLPSLRAKAGDRAVLRAMHYFSDDRRAAAEKEALQNGRFGEFLRLVRESGVSSWTLLQNIYSPKAPEEQPIALGLARSATFLGGLGACRVHGGGFAGTIQAFVPDPMADDYMKEMDSLFGRGAALRLSIRNLPSCELTLE